MDSFDTNNDVIATNLSQSAPLQDSTSPIFSNIYDLSPIKPAEGAVVTESFPEHGYSPQVFTSPRINPQSQSSSLERPQYHHLSTEYSKQYDDKNNDSAPIICTPGKLHTDLSYQVNSHDGGHMRNGSALGKGGTTSQYVDEYLSNLFKVDTDEAVDAANSSLMHSDSAAAIYKDFAGCINYNSNNGEQHNVHERTELQKSAQISQLYTYGGEPAGVISTEQNAVLHGSHAPKYGSIGLHLNSIVNALPMGCGATFKSSDKGYITVQGKKLFCTTDSHSTENVGNSPTSSKAVDHLLVRTEEMERRSCASTAYDEREYAKLSPQKKRKRSTGSSDRDGCKGCNCKKTKCLKLYCNCFASGYYCAKTCSCQGCFNTPEYEDTVLETRRQIVSRDPLAFDPKILQRVGESPANDIQDINKSTHTSLRHKRGCNCKKSMCLKRYCECYQSNIGCSDGGGSAGCQNVYGKKEECGSSKHMAIAEANNDIPAEISNTQKLDTILHSEPSISHHMTNDTSSEPCSESGSFSLLSLGQLSSPLITELGPGSSITGLRSGRKYTLKAVPSSSPLAPCIGVKSSSSPSTNAPNFRNIK